jgi:hypothetical protein
MIQLNQTLIHKSLQETKAKVFVFAELSRLLQQHLQEWVTDADNSNSNAPVISAESLGAGTIIEAIVKAGVLKKAVLPFPYREDVRFLFGEVDLLDLVQSLNHVGYFTHFTAIHLNSLTEQSPKTIYFNIEQRMSGGMGQLTQEALDRAFRVKSRMSSNVVEYKGTRIVKVNGRNTNCLGVSETRRDGAGILRVTDRERTLIDATVRPAYSGGIAVVARAFELAKKSVSVNRITAYLRKLRYVYPYHQAIGFYMERAGYDEPLLKMLDQFPIEYDFYIQHAMKSPVLHKRWRLYVPKGF